MKSRSPLKAFIVWLLVYMPFIPIWWAYNLYHALDWRDLADVVISVTVETLSLLDAPFHRRFWKKDPQ